MHVFVLWSWQGTPAGGREIEPAWFSVGAIPYPQMWADTAHWLPRVLAGERVLGHFVFAVDNETVERAELQAWPDPAGSSGA